MASAGAAATTSIRPDPAKTVDIHRVTKWSKLGTTWTGVSLDTLLEQAPTEAGGYIEATAMNKHGDIVGTMYLNDRGPGFIWPHGTLTELGVERFPSVLGVNANREVIGNLYNGEGFLGYHWRDGLTTPIGGTVGFRDTRAVAINEAGQIAGTFSNDFNDPHAFLWQTGVLTNLSAPATFPTVTALNDAGKVVGTAIYPDDNRRYPTMWTVFGSTRLGTRHGTPAAINSAARLRTRRDSVAGAVAHQRDTPLSSRNSA